MENSTQAQTPSQRFLPGNYSVNAPSGEYEAKLDFVMFAVGSSRRCFFTHLGTGKKFSLIAYRPGWLETDRPESEINFVNGPIPAQGVYRIVVRPERGRFVWKSAKLIPEHSTDDEA